MSDAGSGATSGIEIELNMRIQRIIWKIQRVAWVLAALLLVAVALGLAGDGPLSDASVSDEAGLLTVGYSRFARDTAPTTVRATLKAASPESDQVKLWIDDAFLQEYKLESIIPEPDSTTLAQDRLVFSFSIEQPGNEVEIVLELEPQRTGRLHLDLGLVDGPEHEITQFVLP